MTNSGRRALEATSDEPYTAIAGEPPRVGGHTRSLTKTRGEHLAPRPGHWSRIRSPEAIVAALAKNDRRRGLLLAGVMLMSCGRDPRVQKRVERLINESTGRRVDLKNDCLIRENVMRARLRFCPRGLHRSWREMGLRKVEA